jgi:hypothetical protein
LILSNFIEIEELEKIFWSNLFDIKELENIFTELIWYWKNKPFECVWTYDESLFSLFNATYKYKNNNFYILNILENYLKKEELKNDFKKLENKLSKIYDASIIPSEFKKYLI